MPEIKVTWTLIRGQYDKDEDIKRFLSESTLSTSQSNSNLKLRVDFKGKRAAKKNQGGWYNRNVKSAPTAAGAAGHSESATSSDQGSAAAASS